MSHASLASAQFQTINRVLGQQVESASRGVDPDLRQIMNSIALLAGGMAELARAIEEIETATRRGNNGSSRGPGPVGAGTG